MVPLDIHLPAIQRFLKQFMEIIIIIIIMY
jgi:hypothetical protein